jgi:polysaccharide biosynthesis protein PslG
MSEIVQSRGDCLRLLSNFQLTRRMFLRATCLATGIGSVYLTGCSGTTDQGGKRPVTPTKTSVLELSQGLPNIVVPLGLGVNVHFKPTTTAFPKIEQLANLGFHFVRMDLLWNQVESQKGHYDFSEYERLIGALSSRGIRSLCILDYNNPLYDNTPSPPSTVEGIHIEEARQAFSRFAAAAAARFKGEGIVWEIWNEPDYPRFWQPKPNPDDYMSLTKGTVNAMRQADPNATIVAPALIGLEPKYQEAWDFLERCFALDLLMLVDAISVHPYRLGPPESAIADYSRLRTLTAKYASKEKENIPTISSEWGYSLTWVSQEQQAAYFVRLFLINLLNDLLLSIWYDWQDDGSDVKQVEDNYGIVTWNNQPKMAYFAAQTLTRELSGFHFKQRLPLASDADYQLLFLNGAAMKRVLWTAGRPHVAIIPTKGSSAKITTMVGKKSILRIVNGELLLKLTGNPQYLELSSE